MTRQISIEHGKLDDGLKEALLDVRAALANNAVELLNVVPSDAISSNSNVNLAAQWKRLVLRYKGASGANIIKLFSPGGFLRRFYYFSLKRDPLRHSYRLHALLQQPPIVAPRPLACGQIADGLFPTASFFIMEEVAESIPIADYLRAFLAEREYSLAAKQQLISYIAQRMALMHNRGFFHGDIKPAHFFVRSSSANIDPDQTEWLCIDLDGSALRSKFVTRRRIFNLYQAWRYFVRPIDGHALNDFVHYYRAAANARLPRESKLAEAIAVRFENEISRWTTRHGWYRQDLDLASPEDVLLRVAAKAS